METKTLLNVFAGTLRVNTEAKNKFLDLELKLEAQRKDFEELKTIVLNLSLMINNMQTVINNIKDKQTKSL